MDVVLAPLSALPAQDVLAPLSARRESAGGPRSPCKPANLFKHYSTPISVKTMLWM